MPYPIEHHISRQENDDRRQPGNPTGVCNGLEGIVAPACVPIESVCDMVNIPGTTLYMGSIGRVVQSWTNEVATLTERRGQRLGCGHVVFNIHEYVTPTGVYRGVGNQCPYCTAEAVSLLNENRITLPQAEAMSLCCSRCARSCHSCGRNNLCARHVGLVDAPDAGGSISLCVDCLATWKRRRLWHTVVAIILAPFVDRDRLAQPR